MTVPLILLAFFAVTVGFIAFNYTDAYGGFVHFIADDEKFHINWWLTIVSLLLALAGVVIGWMAYVKGSISHEAIARRFAGLHRVMVNKYYVDEVYQWVINRIVLVLGRLIAWFDRAIINDVGVNRPAWTVMFSALRTRYIQTGRSRARPSGSMNSALSPCTTSHWPRWNKADFDSPPAGSRVVFVSTDMTTGCAVCE